MKTSLKLLAIIASIFLSSDLLAQDSVQRFNQFSPAVQPFTVIEKPVLKLLTQASIGRGSQLPFMNHLPSTLSGENRKHNIDHSQTDPAYYYAMPIIKPGKTIDIPIGKLDPNSPYTYNMPIRKSGLIAK